MNAMPCPDLETRRLLLRKLSLADVDDLFQVFSDEETTVYVPRNKHVDKTETLNHLKNLIKRMDEGKTLVWSVVDKKDKRVIGTVNLYLKQDRAASIGAVICRERIEGKCESNHAASEKVLKKLGMTYEGTLRKEVIINGIPRDVKVYSVLIDECNASFRDVSMR